MIRSVIFLEISFSQMLIASLIPLVKWTDITSVHRKDSKSGKNNYRSVSILSNICNFYERIMFKQMPEYFESHFFSEYQYGFRKGFSAQHCLVSMLEKWKSATDDKKSFGTLLTDLSKTFGWLSRDLLISNLIAQGFNMSDLRFIHSYLQNRMQRTKINSEHSSWKETMFAVRQASIL